MAQHTDPLSGARYPDDNEPPSIAQFIQNGVNDLSSRVIPRFATAAARTTAYANWVAAGNSMVSGLTCFTQSDGRYWRYDTASSSWLYAGGNPPPIVACTAGTGWTNTAVDPPGAYRDSSGLIHLIGAVQPQSAYNPTDGGTHTALQLPSGYFPAAGLRNVLIAVPSSSSNAVVFGQISTAGVLSIVGGTTGTVGITTNHYLDAVVFHPTHNNSVPFA